MVSFNASFNTPSLVDGGPDLRPLTKHQSYCRTGSTNANLWAVIRMVSRLDGASVSQRSCLRKVIRARALMYEGSKKRIDVRNAFRCRSPLCYACGPSRTARFANDLERALATNEERGGSAWFLTLTVPSSTEIEEQLDLLSKSYRFFSKEMSRRMSGARIGFSYSYDLTFKMKKGKLQPHLHLHLILFSSNKKQSISKDEVFEIWSRAVRNTAKRELYLSKKAFYFDLIQNHQAASRYVSKFLTSALELANTQGKNAGLRDLYGMALEDARARKVLGRILKAFFGKHYSSIGGYAGALLPDEDEGDEMMEPVEGEGSEEERISIAVPTQIHSTLIDVRLIESFHHLMMKSCQDRRVEWFVASYDDFIEEYNSSFRHLSYRKMEVKVLEGLERYFGLSVDQQ